MNIATKLKEHLITAAIAVFGLVVLYLAMRASEFGISGWLGGVLGLTTFMCFVLVLTFRSLDPFRKRACLLLALSLLLLSGIGYINEFWALFFTPTRLHLLLAFLPSVAFVGYHAWKGRANATFK